MSQVIHSQFHGTSILALLEKSIDTEEKKTQVVPKSLLIRNNALNSDSEILNVHKLHYAKYSQNNSPANRNNAVDCLVVVVVVVFSIVPGKRRAQKNHCILCVAVYELKLKYISILHSYV